MKDTEPRLQGTAFEDFKAHCSGTQTITELVLSQILEVRHPDYHVTEVGAGDFDLLGYAAAGFAKYELEEDDHTYTNCVEYQASAFRIDRGGDAGKLGHKVYWARYQYIWNGQRYLLYSAIVRTSCGEENSTFLLQPRGAEVASKGLTPSAEKLLLSAEAWSNELHDEVYVFDMAFWSKSKALWQDLQSSSWSDVVLNPVMKDNLIEDVDGFFNSRDLYREFQVPWKRGIIFHGLPGNGKTISIKALMARLQKRENDPIPSLYVKSFEDRRSGSQYAIHKIFRKARSMAPCLLIFEDLDSLIKNDTRSYFLNEVDGLENNDGILMIGSTNHLDKLDPAIRDRPSRFDRKYHYKLPQHAERASYAKYWKKKLERNPRVEFPDEACDVIATMTDGFSFAYLKELFVATMLTVARGGKGDESSAQSTTSEANEEKKDSTTLPTEGKVKEGETQKAAELRSILEAAQLRRQAVTNAEIPVLLKESILVKVIRQQILVLLDDMDNNEVSKLKKKDEGKSGSDGQDSDSD